VGSLRSLKSADIEAITPGEEACEKCYYFYEFSRFPHSIGECRNSPPIITSKEEDLPAQFPKVDAGYWCGEYRKNRKKRS